MSKLTEKFNEYDNLGNMEDQLKQRIQILLNENKDNQPLLQYIELCEELKKTQEKLNDKELKDSLFNLSNMEDVDFLEGNNFTLQRVKDYIKQEIDKKKLEKQYPEVFKECLFDKTIKGHLTIKRKLEE